MDRIVDAKELREDDEIQLRPKYLEEYIGQDRLTENLKIFIQAAKLRNETLDHVLLYGPPGLGKTTLSYILANEMNANIKTTSGPSIDKAGDIASILSSLEPGDILFIDEIHRLSKTVEEILYPAMEDFYIDIVVGKEASVRSIRLELPPFTLIGATTRVGDLSSPFRDRFGIHGNLEYYSIEDLAQIIRRSSKVLDINIDESAIELIASASRGTPRIANRILKRIRDFAQVLNNNLIDRETTLTALESLRIDSIGLDSIDRKYLMAIIERFKGGPVGLEALAASISEDKNTLEEVYEPYLLQIGFITRTARGRIVLDKAYSHLNISK